ncbi:MAG TPA: bifunctional riboflavin kinase/FAD synthetase, partial [Acidimicrobiales bacterium]|nr:bifunctional riboflavin kinase/FAD synthetase [Acidimicrobiales bacterium]
DGDGPADPRLAAVAVGVFDGLHRGHQAVLATVRARALERGLVPAVVTFDPPPAVVLAPERAPRRLQTLAQRLEGLSTLGIERIRVVTFSHDLAHEGADDFVARVLVGEVHAAAVVVGEDFRFGRDREGDLSRLVERGARAGFSAEGLGIVGEGGRFSSTAVRHALDEGDVLEAARVLGRPFALRGRVAPGDARGRELGFATANLDLDPLQQLPADGVYAALARVAPGEWRAAAVSVGTRPQYYEDGARLVEAHVLDFTGDLYGAEVDLAFLARLRDQEVFADGAALARRIALDVAATRSLAGGATAERAELLRWDVGQRR